MKKISLSVNGKFIETTPDEHLERCLEEAQAYSNWANYEADDDVYNSLNESEVNQLLSYIDEIQSSIHTIEDNLKYRLSEIENDEDESEEDEDKTLSILDDLREKVSILESVNWDDENDRPDILDYYSIESNYDSYRIIVKLNERIEELESQLV